jgi:hypothetical protein
VSLWPALALCVWLSDMASRGPGSYGIPPLEGRGLNVDSGSQAAQRHARQEAASAIGQDQKADRFRHIGRDAKPKVPSR